MADNMLVASDDISSAHYQRVKTTLGPDGTATADWAGRQISAAIGGAAYVDVVQKSFRVAQTPTISTSIYAAGDAVGGLLTFANCARASGLPFLLRSVVIVDADKENAVLNLALFDRTFTISADNAAFDPTDADLANHVGTVPIVAADYGSFSDNSAATKIVPEGGLLVVPNGTDLFGQLYLVSGTPTYTATSDLTVIVSGVQF